MKILPLWAVLTAAGGALCAEDQVSPNLSIVSNAEKQQSKPKDGFTALLKKSARSWGKGLLQVVVDAGRNKRHYAKASPRKPLANNAKVVQNRKLSPSASPAALADSFEPVSSRSYLCHKLLFKEEISAEVCRGMVFSAETPPHRVKPGPEYTLSLELPSLRRFLDWFKPVASITSRSQATTNAQAVISNAMAMGEGELRLMTGANTPVPGLTQHTHAIFSDKYHFTIDPTKPRTSLTHGAMGAGFALSRDRSRNNRA